MEQTLKLLALVLGFFAIGWVLAQFIDLPDEPTLKELREEKYEYEAEQREIQRQVELQSRPSNYPGY